MANWKKSETYSTEEGRIEIVDSEEEVTIFYKGEETTWSRKDAKAIVEKLSQLLREYDEAWLR